MSIERTRFGKLADGADVHALTIGNGTLKMRVLTYGCILQSLGLEDGAGETANVVLGFEQLDPYLSDSPYFGAVIGRYANRIANATFSIAGQSYRLTANEGPHHLHGGLHGFDKQVWDAETAGESVIFRRRSPDGEEGFPGNLDVQVTYALSGWELSVTYEAATDAPTHVNLTQHAYFNLQGAGDVLGHCLAINAGTYLPVDDRLIPTGEFAPVANTPFDFRESTAIGSRMRVKHVQLARGGGYDHTFVLQRAPPGASVAARLLEPRSRRTLEVRTTEPGLQFYAGQAVGHRGLCLEPQHFPDSPNRPAFPSTLLRPGDVYRSMTRYIFGTQP